MAKTIDQRTAELMEILPEACHATVRAALLTVAREQRERDAEIAEAIYPPAHTYSSENGSIYKAQDETMRLIANMIRTQETSK